MDKNEITDSGENKIEMVMDGIGLENKIGVRDRNRIKINDQPSWITQDFPSFKTESPL